MSSEEQQRRERLKAALAAIDETRREFDRAVAQGDKAIAAKLLKMIGELAKECDQIADDLGAT